MEPCMEVNMFGGLRVTWGEKVLADASTRINKPLEVLVALLSEKDRTPTNEQLITQIWEESEVENPAGALKNAAYSLRKQLQSAQSQTEFIITENNGYRWNPKIPIKVDIWEFDALQAKMWKERERFSQTEQLEIGRAALRLYVGEFLPGLQDQQWAVQQANILRHQYIDMVCATTDILLLRRTRETLEEAHQLCASALRLEPLAEEIYLRMFQTMQGLAMKKDIMQYYPVVEELFLSELGEPPAEEIQDVYRWASETVCKPQTDIHVIQQDLENNALENSLQRGPYYCPYEVFRNIFHIELRAAPRNGTNVVLMLLTLCSEDGTIITKSQLAEAMPRLKVAMRNSMRKGDVCCRYSQNQYIVMFSARRTTDGETVRKRIEKAYQAQKQVPNVVMEALVSAPEIVI